MGKVDAILKTGTFGVHIVKNPAKTFSLVGTVPDTCTGAFETFDAALSAFFDFIKSMPVEWQRDNVPNLRNDIFTKFLEA